MTETIAIVGASLAGGRAAEAMRRAGFDGRVILIGEESWLPYERPPLSKVVLWDQTGLPANFFLHDEAWYAANRIELRLGVRVEALDLADGGIRLATGESLAADRILLATGARARRLPLAGADMANVCHLRTKDEAERLRAALRPGVRLVVIGMGIIGAEVAASASKIGCAVTVIEPAAAPMIRAIGARFGRWLGGRHEARGVRARFGVAVTRLIVDAGGVRAIECTDGARIDCDVVVVGIGIIPNTDLARGAGLETDNGIVVDRQGRTSHRHVFAAGDVAAQPGFFGGRARLETYQNAADQAAAAGAAMSGRDADYCRPGWFWSDQYDLHIQGVGRIDDGLPTTVRGDPETESFSAFFLDDGVVVGAVTVNRTAEMSVARRLVERRLAPHPGALADPSVSLRDLLRHRDGG